MKHNTWALQIKRHMKKDTCNSFNSAPHFGTVKTPANEWNKQSADELNQLHVCDVGCLITAIRIEYIECIDIAFLVW